MSIFYRSRVSKNKRLLFGEEMETSVFIIYVFVQHLLKLDNSDEIYIYIYVERERMKYISSTTRVNIIRCLFIRIICIFFVQLLYTLPLLLRIVFVSHSSFCFI